MAAILSVATYSACVSASSRLTRLVSGKRCGSWQPPMLADPFALAKKGGQKEVPVVVTSRPFGHRSLLASLTHPNAMPFPLTSFRRLCTRLRLLPPKYLCEVSATSARHADRAVSHWSKSSGSSVLMASWRMALLESVCANLTWFCSAVQSVTWSRRTSGWEGQAAGQRLPRKASGEESGKVHCVGENEVRMERLGKEENVGTGRTASQEER